MTIGAGGADVIIRAMVSLLKASGGEVLTGTPVERIEVSGGRTTGVVLADGRRIAATRAVVANVHPKLVFGRLLAADPARAAFDRKIAAFRAGPGTMMIPPRHERPAGLARRRGAQALRLRAPRPRFRDDGPGLYRGDGGASAGRAGRRGRPADGARSVPRAGRPARSVAPGPGAPAEIRGDALRQITDTDWDAVKEAYADRVLDLIERYAPGLRGKILGRPSSRRAISSARTRT